MKLTNLTKAASVLAAVAAAVTLAGCDKKPQAQRPRGPVPVVAEVVAVAPVSLQMELAGRTSAHEVAEVRPQVAGILKARLFEEGAEVKAGQQLYQIESAAYEAAVASASANVVRAEAALENYRNTAKRFAGLVKENAVSRQENEDAQARVKVAAAELAAARAQLKSAKINLEYTKVLSPISGRVSRSEVTPGALLAAHQPGRMTSVTQLDPIYVDVVQSSADILRLRRQLSDGTLRAAAAKGSATVSLVLEDGTVYPVAGKLQFSDVTVDSSTGTVNLRAVFPNPDRVLLPGMYVRARMAEGSRPDAICIAQRSLMRNTHGDPYVYTIEGGKVVQRMVQVDRAVGKTWLITSGLKAGEQVVYDGHLKVRPGVPVKVTRMVDNTGKPLQAAASKPAAK